VLLIPINNVSDQTLQVQLDQQQALLRIRWSPLARRWYMDMSVGSERLTSGRLIATEQAMINDSRFRGEIMALPIDGTLDDPAWGAWGSTHQLFYVTPVEIDRA